MNADDLVKQQVEELLEHFDSVRIFVTKHEGGKDQTRSFTWGGGNFYAQYGQITEWKFTKEQEAKNPSNEE